MLGTVLQYININWCVDVTEIDRRAAYPFAVRSGLMNKTMKKSFLDNSYTVTRAHTHGLKFVQLD
jgi:hypothetical protein